MGLLNSPSAELYKTWTRGLYDLSERQIRHGLMKAMDFTGFFNLPSFRELCRVTPEELGIPDCRAAMNESLSGGWISDRAWSHPVVYHTVRAVGSYDMQSLSEEKLWPLFKYNYDLMVKRFIDGEDLSIPVQKVIPAKVEVPKTQEEIEAMQKRTQESIDNLRKLFAK